MLKLTNVHAAYGPIVALQGISLEVPEGGIVAVLGANGAGKSSTLRAISGLLRPSQGTIEFNGERIDRHSPEKIVREGISQVPEGRELFTDLSVRENLMLGAYSRNDRPAIQKDLDRVHEYFPLLAERKDRPAGSLSGGEQQMLAIGRGLMSRPRLLLLDEPSVGLAPILVRDIFKIIGAINKEDGITILLVEQDANMALGLAQHAYLLETGSVVLDDSAEKLRSNEAVRKSYLGY
ncbi:MAG: ABC transporter ATP-binding protein [Phycisphaerales bacterium]